MLGIWHRGDWMKRYMAQSIYGRMERGSPIPDRLLHSLMRSSFPWNLMCKCTGSYEDPMANVSLIFLLLFCWL